MQYYTCYSVVVYLVCHIVVIYLVVILETHLYCDLGDAQFELKQVLINMVQANPFYGKPHEDANAHLQHIMEVCGTIAIKGVTIDTIRLCRFSYSPCSGR